MKMNRWSVACAVLIAGVLADSLFGQSSTPLPPPPQTQQVSSGTRELVFDQGKRLFDAFQYDQALPVFDSLILMMTAAGQGPPPDLLVQTYELRARSRFALSDSAGAEQDFAALLAIRPDFKLGAGVSPRVAAVLDGVRKLTIGQAVIAMTPPGEIRIDGRSYTIQGGSETIALPSGEHHVTVTRSGYRPVDQKFTVTAATETPLTLTLERVSSTLSVVSVPAGVEVVVDGTSRGVTEQVGQREASTPLVVADLPLGAHRLQLRRECYVELDRAITIGPEDVQTEPLRLAQAIARVKVATPEPGAAVFVDGKQQGRTPADLNVCAGRRVIEVRGPNGRFVDRRDWKTGDLTTIPAELRGAFPIVTSNATPGVTAEQLRVNVERALAPAKHVLVFAPTEPELQAALRDENIPPHWLGASLDAGQTQRIPRETTRELGRRLTARLGAQGVAAVSVGPEPFRVTVWLLAGGSGEPDVLNINMADPASQARAVEMLSASLPAIVRPSLEIAVVDSAGAQGAVVVRTGGVGAKAGLVVGDTIVGAADKKIASVADLRAALSAVTSPGASLALEVRGPAGAVRTVSTSVAMTPDAFPPDPAILRNRALLELRGLASTAATPVARLAAHLNLAIVHMRVGNWDEAQAALKDVQLPDGPGVSAGTVAYLTGLALEGAGRVSEAQAAFARAAAAPNARLWSDGPLVAPLAKQKIQPRR